MKKLFITIGITAIWFSVNAQNQEVVSSAGGHDSNGNVQVSWTVGEPVTETASNGNNIITQGFHQTNLTITRIDEKSVDLNNLNINIYPNPAVDYVNMDIKGDNLPELYYKLTDENGKVLLSDKSLGHKRIDMSTYDPSVYFINVYNKDKSFVRVFKVIKSKK